MTDTAEGLLERHLLSELVAEGLLEPEDNQFFYRGPRHDYRVEVTVTPVTKIVRLSED